MNSDYNILQEIGGGPQGTVFLVEDKRYNNELRILKKIECKDEAEASRSFKEAMILKTLSHPNVSSYQDMFVSWDEKDSAIYVCLVMDYYKDGDLGARLGDYRDRQEPIDHTLIMKWAGQMVDALVYVHKNKIIHRGLKPTNVFLSGDQDLVVGDFGVPTLMESAKSVISSSRPVGAISWMAPEVFEGIRCDETADIYSLGSIMLEMATCGLLDYNEIHHVLFESKDDRVLFDETLDKIEKTYGSGPAEMIRKCMRRAYKQRPTAAQLCKLPYMQKCLKLCHSHLHTGVTSDSNLTESDGGEPPVPSTGGMDALLEYLHANSTSLGCQLLGLRQLLKQQDLSNMSEAGKLQLVHTMTLYKESGEVQQLSCQVLAMHAASGELLKKDVLFSETFIDPIFTTIRFHSSSQTVVSNVTALLMALATDEVAAGIIGAHRGIQDILCAMRKFPEDLEIVSNCVTIIMSLSLIEGNMKLLTDLKAVQDVYLALETHMDSRDLVEAATSTLWALSMTDENVVLMAKLGAVEVLLKTITMYTKDAGIVRFSCSALSSLAEVQELSAHHIMQTEANVNGFSVIKTTADSLPSESQVIESIAFLIRSLAYYDVIREELLSLDAVPFLTKLSLTFSSADSVSSEQSPVCAAIDGALASLTQAKDEDVD